MQRACPTPSLLSGCMKKAWYSSHTGQRVGLCAVLRALMYTFQRASSHASLIHQVSRTGFSTLGLSTSPTLARPGIVSSRGQSLDAALQAFARRLQHQCASSVL